MNASTTVKKNLVIFHNPEEWNVIWEQLVVEHGVKLNISWVLRRDLGFHVRTHQGLASTNNASKPGQQYYQAQVHLDFYNESVQSWFIIKYLHR